MKTIYGIKGTYQLESDFSHAVYACVNIYTESDRNGGFHYETTRIMFTHFNDKLLTHNYPSIGW